jgi:transposase
VDLSSEGFAARVGQHGVSLEGANSVEGGELLAAFCRQHHVDLVVMEATGGYEKLLFSALWAAGVACAIVNPRSVRRFAEAMGVLEKTDRIDAGIIAWYGEVKRLCPQEPASANQERLRALVGRLRQLTAARVAQSNQRRFVSEPMVLASIEEIMTLLRRQIRQLEAAIGELISTDLLWSKLDDAFRSIKGVADRTVCSLMALFPEIGTVANKAAAKLIGLAPFARDSGKHIGKRTVRGGRSPIRAILFTVAEIVRRHDPEFADFHRRLIVAGKPKKVVRIALARKLLVKLNAKARDVRRELALAT